jgi:hypothetical protein
MTRHTDSDADSSRELTEPSLVAKENNLDCTEAEKTELERYLNLVRSGSRVSTIKKRSDGRKYFNLYDPKLKKNVAQVTNEAFFKSIQDEYKRVAHAKEAAGATEPADTNNTQLFAKRIQEDMPLMKELIENTTWYQSAISEIGLSAFFMALQVGDFDPEQAAQDISRFRDAPDGKKQFVAYVRKRLQALFEAHKNGSRIAKLDHDLVEEKMISGIFEMAYEAMRDLATKWSSLFSMATSSMCEGDLRALLEKRILADLVDANTGPSQEEKRVREAAIAFAEGLLKRGARKLETRTQEAKSGESGK